MAKQRGFLEYTRKDPGYREIEERTRDFKAVEKLLNEEEIVIQSARCMDCGTPFCHGYGCPLANIVPEFNEMVYRKKWEDAARLLLNANTFPEFTGRICPALCEASCVLSINDKAVTIRQIELAIIEKGFREGFINPEPPASRNNFRVAVVGSGPAGLAAATILNKAGYTVTVFEKDRKPGGILRYGIPDFKLEKLIIDRRIRLMIEEGVIFETGVNVGTDVSYNYLKSRFNAVVLCGGTLEGRELKIPGRELKGIHQAMEYLVQQNKLLNNEDVPADQLISARDKHVVIIGGGDTGADCLGTAIRQGAASVTQLEILSEPPAERSIYTPWPQWPYMLRESSSHKEGGKRMWSVNTKEFIGTDGHVSELKAIGVEWTPGPNGLPATFREKPGTEFTVKADLVILAMGFTSHGNRKLVDETGVSVSGRGFIITDEYGRTSVPDIFSAGDMASGPSLVVRAIQSGKMAAEGVMTYLGSRT